MATVNLTYASPINISCKVGDTAYFVNTASMGGFEVSGSINEIGVINSITDTYTDGSYTSTVINVELTGENAEGVTANDFIFFSKNNLVEISSILGYYAKAQYRNNSTDVAEFHATACVIAESSK